MKFLKNHFSTILILLVVCSLICWVFFILTPQIKLSEESFRKIDSLNTTIKLLEQDQHKLDSEIVKYNQEITSLDKNISKIKTEKTIIREIYHEKINSVNNFNTNQLDSFFSNRYNY